MAIDTHCHLNDETFDDVIEVAKNLKQNNVSHAVCVGYNLESSLKAVELSHIFDNIYAEVGLHPENVDDIKEGDFEKIQSLLLDEKVVALGEIGLDYHWQPFDKERQKEVFLRQIEIAKLAKMPIVIHQRDCGMDILNIVKEHRKDLTDVVLHCFSESVEMAREFIKLNCYISFAGPLTFKNAGKALEVAKIVPTNLLLTETDSPYLTPHPYRGSRNEPKYVNLVLAKLAEIRGADKSMLEEQILLNAKRVFKKIVI